MRDSKGIQEEEDCGKGRGNVVINREREVRWRKEEVGKMKKKKKKIKKAKMRNSERTKERRRRRRIAKRGGGKVVIKCRERGTRKR